MSKQSEFIDKMAQVICRIAKQRGYKYPSAIIAQSILESGWGSSKLAKYYNFFGMKCGSSWTGKVVGMDTQEQRSDGSYYTVKNDAFRAYDSLEDGIKGYFDFISKPRYSNLKDATSPRDYLQKLKNDGYATSLKYVDNNMRVINTYDLTRFDNLDNVSRETSEQIPPDLDNASEVFARYCIAGLLGNGEDRKNRIYKIVQDKVNRMVK